SRAAGPPGTGSPSHHPRASAAPRGPRRSSRSGAPPTRTVPPARLSRPGSGRRRIPAGTGARTGSFPAGRGCPGRGVALAGTVWKHISSDHAAVAWRPGRRHGRRPLMSTDNAGTEAAAEVPTEAEDAAETEELLVEEISIDGMCGVY